MKIDLAHMRLLCAIKTFVDFIFLLNLFLQDADVPKPATLLRSSLAKLEIAGL